MKTLRTTISTFIFIALFIVTSILSVYLSNLVLFICCFIFLILLFFIFIKIENKKLLDKVKPLIENLEYDKAIDELKILKDKVFMINSYNSCIITLIQLYMLNDDLDNARLLINSHELLRSKNKNLFYISFIIATYDNDQKNISISYEKIQKLDKLYVSQKEVSRKILNMISSNIFDEEVYNTTTYPQVKRICERYMDNNYIINNSSNSNNFNNKMNINNTIKIMPRHIRIIKLILNIFSIISLFIFLVVISIKLSKYSYLTNIESMYYIVSHMWILYLLIIIPIGNMIFSVYLKKNGYKYKDNLIIGIIMCVIYFIYGSFTFIFKDNYTFDKSYFETIEKNIDINMADEYYIITEGFEDTGSSSTDGVCMHKQSVVRFNESVVINHNVWMNELSNYKIVPTMFITLTTNYEHFLIYDKTSALINPDSLIYNHTYIVMAFDVEYSHLLIYEYSVVKK